MYNRHPNKLLKESFERKPYQGVKPENARYLFIGLDANFDIDIENSRIFNSIIDYLDDGVSFWENYGVHHPFMLPAYNGDGRAYHRNFSKIGFERRHASDVCFIELLDFPTFGQSKLEIDDLNPLHLKRIDNIVRGGTVNYVFVSPSVGRLMLDSGQFTWMLPTPMPLPSSLRLWGTVGKTQVLWHYHFSVYGKFEQAKRNQLSDIRDLIFALD